MFCVLGSLTCSPSDENVDKAFYYPGISPFAMFTEKKSLERNTHQFVGVDQSIVPEINTIFRGFTKKIPGGISRVWEGRYHADFF